MIGWESQMLSLNLIGWYRPSEKYVCCYLIGRTLQKLSSGLTGSCKTHTWTTHRWTVFHTGFEKQFQKSTNEHKCIDQFVNLVLFLQNSHNLFPNYPPLSPKKILLYLISSYTASKELLQAVLSIYLHVQYYRVASQWWQKSSCLIQLCSLDRWNKQFNFVQKRNDVLYTF